MLKKVIIPVGGLGTRFLPLTKIVAKETLPLADKPMISYIVEEARRAGISHVVFVFSERKKEIIDYFKKAGWLENILEKRKKEDLLEELKNQEKEFEKISFSWVLQEKPLGDGDAILKAKGLIGKIPCGVLFSDDIFEAKNPVIGQLDEVFKTSQKPVIGLKKISKEKLLKYGVVAVEKIAHRLYKIKDIIEKPKDISKAPSDLAICGRYVINSEVFDYLKTTPATESGEIILANALKLMIKNGKTIYGYEIEGEWLECGTKEEWLKSNLYFCFNHPKFGKELKEWAKKII